MSKIFFQLFFSDVVVVVEQRMTRRMAHDAQIISQNCFYAIDNFVDAEMMLKTPGVQNTVQIICRMKTSTPNEFNKITSNFSQLVEFVFLVEWSKIVCSLNGCYSGQGWNRELIGCSITCVSLSACYD